MLRAAEGFSANTSLYNLGSSFEFFDMNYWKIYGILCGRTEVGMWQAVNRKKGNPGINRMGIIVTFAGSIKLTKNSPDMDTHTISAKNASHFP